MPKTRSQTKKEDDFGVAFSLAMRATMENQPSARPFPPITNYPDFKCK